MHNILIRPVFTEKVTALTGSKNVYAFIVDIAANKIEIAKAVTKKFSVKVDAVRTVRHQGKSKTSFTKRGRYTGKTARFKKAYVTLHKGEAIELMQNA